MLEGERLQEGKDQKPSLSKTGQIYSSIKTIKKIRLGNTGALEEQAQQVRGEFRNILGLLPASEGKRQKKEIDFLSQAPKVGIPAGPLLDGTGCMQEFWKGKIFS